MIYIQHDEEKILLNMNWLQTRPKGFSGEISHPRADLTKRGELFKASVRRIFIQVEKERTRIATPSGV